MNRKEIEANVPRIAGDIVRKQGFVRSIDVFIAMSKLREADYEDWRRRRVPYLERVIQGSLNSLLFILRALRSYAIRNHLKPSLTVYKSWGKGKKDLLRFSKSGSEYMESLYSTHYISKEYAPNQRVPMDTIKRKEGKDGSC
jgi:hypothetical protein